MMLCNHQDDTRGMSIAFFRIVAGFMIFQSLSTVLNAALRGIGKTKVTLVSNIAMGAVDIIFNYLLIEGNLGFPRLEVAGDAIATVLGTVAACLVSVIAIVKHSGFLTLRGMFRERIRANREGLKAIWNKAGNIIFENFFTRIGFLLSSIIVSMLSSDETAVYSVAMILLNYSFAFGDGIQSAVVALTLLQILRIVQIGVMRGMGEVKDPRRIATLCVLFVNPLSSYLLTIPAQFGVWGIWQGSVITQGLWFVLSLIFCRKNMKRLSEKGAFQNAD